MHSRMDALQTMVPVNLRRVANNLHSVAKQASFQTLFFRVPGRFYSDFGRLWEAKTDANIDFWDVFCDAFFEGVSESIFWQFFIIF